MKLFKNLSSNHLILSFFSLLKTTMFWKIIENTKHYLSQNNWLICISIKFLSSNSLFPTFRIILPLKKILSPSTQSDVICIFTSVCKSHLIINLTRSREQRWGQGVSSSFRQAPCPISTANPHLKTPQNRYCETQQDPNIKQDSSLKVGMDLPEMPAGMLNNSSYTPCLFRPRLNYWQNGQTTQNCERYILPIKIMIVLGIAHIPAAQLVSIFS